MKDEVNPVMNRELYALAESAALAAGMAAVKEEPRRRMTLMDKAGRAVFKRAGTPREAANLYACCITADILEREPVARVRRNSPQKGRLDPF
jgi:hypothetical protein